MSKTRPILFNAEMVRAILDGRKTQTRRVVKPRHYWHVDDRDNGTPWPYYDAYVYAEPDPIEVPCPYGVPGDRLWVRETWCPRSNGRLKLERIQRPFYRASQSTTDVDEVLPAGWRWRPSIHMPRWASRITLEVTGVRVERVQDISEADVVAEGVSTPCQYTRDNPNRATPGGCPCHLFDEPRPYACSFVELWDSINAKRGYGWDVNPWVWVVEFEVVK